MGLKADTPVCLTGRARKHIPEHSCASAELVARLLSCSLGLANKHSEVPLHDSVLGPCSESMALPTQGVTCPLRSPPCAARRSSVGQSSRHPGAEPAAACSLLPCSLRPCAPDLCFFSWFLVFGCFFLFSTFLFSFPFLFENYVSQACWLTPVILALRRLTWEGCKEFKANLNYIVNFSLAWATEQDLPSETNAF